MNPATVVATTFTHELDWLAATLQGRIQLYFHHAGGPESLDDIPVPELAECEKLSAYQQFVSSNQLNLDERLVLMLALAPHLKPEVLDVFYGKNGKYDRRFTEFGGRYGSSHAGFLPTVETAYFILTGGDMARRLECSRIFSPDHLFFTQGILRLERDHPNEPLTSARLVVPDDAVDMLVLGHAQPPVFGEEFPARRLTTAMEFGEMVLRPGTRSQLEEILDWTRHGKTILEDWGLKRKLAPGYKALFHGPPGTGKTLAAAMIGKATGKEVYRIDLALTVSKWIGETEKNLSRVFDKALHKNWILFFDEADALFGKRTEVKDAHDRFANQEVAYLLQRIEEFPGVVLLATNLSQNIDPAFRRRFQAIIPFSMPTASERLTLWRNAFPEQISLGPDIDLTAIAHQHEVAGGFIVNVVRTVCLRVAREGNLVVCSADVEAAIRKEFQKQGVSVISD